MDSVSGFLNMSKIDDISHFFIQNINPSENIKETMMNDLGMGALRKSTKRKFLEDLLQENIHPATLLSKCDCINVYNIAIIKAFNR